MREVNSDGGGDVDINAQFMDVTDAMQLALDLASVQIGKAH